MTPFEKLTGRSSSQTTAKTPQVRQYRPISTGDTVIDNAHRQMFDAVDSLRANYGPTSLFSKGSGVPVTVINTDTPPGNAFSVSLQLNRQGTWMITAAVSLIITADPSVDFTLGLTVNNTTIEHFAVVNQATDGSVMMHQSWQIAAKLGNEVCTLVIRKPLAAAGTSTVDPLNSTLSAFWQGT